MEAATRKLIDIKAPVFKALKGKAQMKGVSLKRYIEDLLEEDSMRGRATVPEGVTDPRIISLIGVAKPLTRTGRGEEEEDDRLNYILSK
ncbi:MAG: hypothetical protein IJ205_05415 [Bacteroidales bacterium]|nr:hypothetical protein [Bacteroidales bacterium]